METKADKTPDDPDSFDRQIQHPELRTRLKNLAWRKGVPEADCEDVASDIVAEAIRCQARYDRQRGAFSTWIIAIGENVIRTHVRTLNAQKRKPEGGIISSNAASDRDANPLEVKDTRAEEERRSSEEAEHFLDTARLSKKEAAAIRSCQDHPQSDGATCSSSTARRARRKLKQVRSDENFSVRPRGPDASECAYGKIPAAERSAAVLFDQLRRTPWFVDAIAQWRKSSEWNHAQAFLQRQAALERFPLRILPEHWPKQLSRYRDAAHQRNRKLRRRLESAVEITLVLPEWPAVGYCQLAAPERRERLEKFGWPFSAEPFWEITEPTFEVFVQAADEIQQPIVSLDAFLEFFNKSPKTGSDVYSSIHLVRVDWRYPIETIMASARRWADKRAKHNLDRLTQAGRPATANLVGFACIRLIDDFGLSLDQAMSWLKARYGGRIPSNPERLERAARATREDLKDFLPSPTEIGV